MFKLRRKCVLPILFVCLLFLRAFSYCGITQITHNPYNHLNRCKTKHLIKTQTLFYGGKKALNKLRIERNFVNLTKANYEKTTANIILNSERLNASPKIKNKIVRPLLPLLLKIILEFPCILKSMKSANTTMIPYILCYHTYHKSSKTNKQTKNFKREKSHLIEKIKDKISLN